MYKVRTLANTSDTFAKGLPIYGPHRLIFNIQINGHREGIGLEPRHASVFSHEAPLPTNVSHVSWPFLCMHIIHTL